MLDAKSHAFTPHDQNLTPRSCFHSVKFTAPSQQIREIFAEYTPLIEPLSLDEAYPDVTENLKGMAIATEIAFEIRTKIKAVTGLNASAGISYNKSWPRWRAT